MLKISTKFVLKQGILMGLAFCLYTIFMWLTKLDTIYLNIGQYLDILIIILPILMINHTITQQSNNQALNITQKIIIAVFMSVVSFLIYDPFLYVYHHYINPDWFVFVINLKEMQLKTMNIPQENVIQTLEKMKNIHDTQSGLFRLSAMIPSVFIIPILIVLISNFITKLKQRIYNQTKL